MEENAKDKYLKAKSLCTSSRSKFSESNFLYMKYASSLSLPDANLMEGTENLTRLVIDIQQKKYEACEYFELAMIEYDSGNFAEGDQKMKLKDEKITEQDELIKEYNWLFAELQS